MSLLFGWGCSGPAPPSCTYVVTPSSASFLAAGGTGALSVTTGSSCSWNASTNASWVNATSGASGKGNGTVQYTVAANSGSSSRSSVVSVGGQSISLSQSGVPTFTLSGTVRDAFLGTPLAGVSVVISSGPTTGSTSTTSGGSYVLSDLLPGAYVVRFSAPRYAIEVASVTAGSNTILDGSLVISTASPLSAADLTGAWVGTGTYPNMPFKLELFQSGATLAGVYRDQHDGTSAVTGTYSSSGFTLRLDFGDAVLNIECTIDDARQVHGVMRTSALGNTPYPYTMVR